MKRFFKLLALPLVLLFVFSFPLYSSAEAAGDVNQDGLVTAEDARFILRCAVELEPLDGEMFKLCDINADGLITAEDARMALRLAVGLPAEGLKEEESSSEAETQAPAGAEKVKLFANAVSRAELEENLHIFASNVGSRPAGSLALGQAQTHIEKILIYNGFDKKYIYKQPFTFYGKAANVIAKITTKVKNPDIILFSAHYDCASTAKGAIDNASGRCSVLELSRVMKKLNLDFGFELRFAFFSAEENGYIGAYQYLRQTPEEELSRHKLIINTDMSGRPVSDKNYYLTVCTEPVTASYKKPAGKNTGSLAMDRAKAKLGSLGEYKYLSPVAAGKHDILPFRERDFPALTLSWREKDASRSGGSDFDLASPSIIHTEKDNFDNLDIQSVYDATRLLAGCAAELYLSYAKIK